jgi:predicted DsbA family dithiol-disulfide isomerase
MSIGTKPSKNAVEAPMSNPIKVDIWSDVACPWCYISKRKIESAIREFSSQDSTAPVEVEYHSYLLNPDMPVDYEGGQTDYLAQHKGMPRDQVIAMTERLVAIAKDVGLDYDMEHMHMTNTVLAHQLLQYAKTQGKQVEMKERIMSAHFVEALHVGRAEVLADLASDVGLDRAEVLCVLESAEFLPAFEADLAQAQAYGISGVPFFVIDGKYGVSGAQNPDVFVKAFNQILEARA